MLLRKVMNAAPKGGAFCSRVCLIFFIAFKNQVDQVFFFPVAVALGLLLLSLQPVLPTRGLLDAVLTDDAPPISLRFVLRFLFVHLRMFFCFRLASSSYFGGPSRVMLGLLISVKRGTAAASTNILLLVTRSRTRWNFAFHPYLCYHVTTAAVWQCNTF